MAISMAGRSQIEIVLRRQTVCRIICVFVPIVLVFPALVFLASGRIATAAEPSTETRAAVDRGLTFLAKDALTWKEQRKCASCHHAPMALWSLNVARNLGYTIDERAVSDLTGWVLAKDDPAKVFPKQPPQKEIFINQSVLLLALGIEAGTVDEGTTREGVKKMLSTLLEKQRPDGSWGLQSLSQPIGSTPEVITSFVLLSLTAPNAPDMGQPGKEARDKGLAWLSATKSDESLQGLAVKMLLWKRLDHPTAEWQPLTQQILARQKPDGGWSQTKELASDAYATGLTLYALAEVGMPADDPAIVKARTFLIKSQAAPGSWPMASRPRERDNKSSTNLAPIVYSGTAWAVMGLMRSEPAAGSSKVSSAK